MLIRIRRASQVLPREITAEELYLRRRELIKGAAVATGAALLAGCVSPGESEAEADAKKEPGKASAASAPAAGGGGPAELRFTSGSKYSTSEPQTEFEDASRYNNFYEFGTDKEDPAEYGHMMKVKPWTVSIEGAVAKPGRIGLEDLLAPHTLEERVYRLRCVEAWSMVIPWIGIPLAAVLGRFEPLAAAKYVAFRTLHDPEQMPGQRIRSLEWPYREGLRIDEAMHPLTILAVGMYGRVLPNQNGAPLRLVVPWKYGFKSIKSIVSIALVESEPETSWNVANPGEYGFYSNVNPEVDHPRWSQASERRIGEFRRRKTLPFNGYAEEVAGLYQGMDLRKFY